MPMPSSLCTSLPPSFHAGTTFTQESLLSAIGTPISQRRRHYYKLTTYTQPIPHCHSPWNNTDIRTSRPPRSTVGQHHTATNKHNIRPPWQPRRHSPPYATTSRPSTPHPQTPTASSSGDAIPVSPASTTEAPTPPAPSTAPRSTPTFHKIRQLM